MPGLVGIIQDGDDTQCDEAVEVLRQIGSPAKRILQVSMSLWVADLKKSDAAARQAAARNLGYIAALLLDHDEPLRRDNRPVEGGVPLVTADQAVIQLAKSIHEDKHSGVRKAAEASLKRMGATGMQTLLITLSNNAEIENRVAAAVAIGKIGIKSDEVNNVLTVAQQRGDSRVRNAAMQALRQLKDK